MKSTKWIEVSDDHRGVRVGRLVVCLAERAGATRFVHRVKAHLVIAAEDGDSSPLAVAYGWSVGPRSDGPAVSASWIYRC